MDGPTDQLTDKAGCRVTQHATKNLRLLVQRPDARSTANIEDLHQVIITSDHVQDTALRGETNVAPGQTENAQVYTFKETKNSA